MNEEIDIPDVCANGKYKLDCPFYNFLVTSRKNFSQPYMYAPVDKVIMDKRGVSDKVKTIIEMEEFFFGQHYCAMSDLIAKGVDKKSYLQAIESCSFKSETPVIKIFQYNWIRQVFNLCVRNIADKRQYEKDEVIVINNMGDVFPEHYYYYFSDVDIFNIFECDGIQRDKRLVYVTLRENRQREYFEYVCQKYSLSECIMMYRQYLLKNPITVPMWANEFNDPTSFSFYFERQYPIYVDLLRAIVDDERIFIVGDGPGTASLAAWSIGRKYASMEPNNIGYIASSIGLITQEPPDQDDIIVLFNVLDYIETEKWFLYSKVLIYDESVSIRLDGFEYHHQGAAKVFYKGIKMRELISFSVPSSRYLFATKDQSVKPMDYRSEILAKIMEIRVADDGVKVTVEENKYMNLLTRNNPKDTRCKSNGSYKWVGKELYKVYPGKNIVFTDHNAYSYYGNEYKAMRFETKYRFVDGFYYIKTLAPHRLEYIIERESKAIVKVYLVKRVMYAGISYGVYREYSSVFATDVRDLDPIDTNDELYENFS